MSTDTQNNTHIMSLQYGWFRSAFLNLLKNLRAFHFVMKNGTNMVLSIGKILYNVKSMAVQDQEEIK